MNITVQTFIDQYVNIIGHGSDSQCAIDLINQARAALYSIGEWVGTIEYGCIQLTEGCFLLPSHLETVKDASFCNNTLVLDNYRNVGYPDYRNCCSIPALTKVFKRTPLPFYNTGNILVGFRFVNKQDNDSVLTVNYIDSAGTNRIEDVKVKHRNPVFLSNRLASAISIEKPFTSGRVEVYIKTSESNCAKVCSRFIEYNETFPEFTLYSVDGACGHRQVAFKAKKKMLPYTLSSLREVLDIHPEALSSAILAVKIKEKQDAGWQSSYAQSIKLATDFLKKELIDQTQTDSGFVVPETPSFVDNLFTP